MLDKKIQKKLSQAISDLVIYFGFDLIKLDH